MTYDATADSERYAAPLREWASMGYLRGFAGMRSDLGPKGKMTLPSAAFHQAAVASLETPPADETEMSARREYVESVEANLMRIQSGVIADHYSKAQRGWIMDLAVGFLSAAICLIAWITLGLYHPVTISLLVLISAKTLIIQYFVRRMIIGSMGAFAAKTTDIKLPWGSERA
jgi:hypothetical protein